jgi:hypothetical protein
MMSEPELRWWVASFADHDTHRGVYSPVTRSIHTLCRREFQSPWPALQGIPPDPLQICPQCQIASQGALTKT